MGLPGRAFIHQHENQVVELKRHLLDFMKTTRSQLNSYAEPNPDPEPTEVLDIKMTENGFPCLPKGMEGKELSKLQCEVLLRDYLSQHYCETVSMN
jgi:hypothetical protein